MSGIAAYRHLTVFQRVATAPANRHIQLLGNQMLPPLLQRRGSPILPVWQRQLMFEDDIRSGGLFKGESTCDALPAD